MLQQLLSFLCKSSYHWNSPDTHKYSTVKWKHILELYDECFKMNIILRDVTPCSLRNFTGVSEDCTTSFLKDKQRNQQEALSAAFTLMLHYACFMRVSYESYDKHCLTTHMTNRVRNVIGTNYQLYHARILKCEGELVFSSGTFTLN
jgi:hypothetical protein